MFHALHAITARALCSFQHVLFTMNASFLTRGLRFRKMLMAPLSASSMFQSFRLHFFSINSTGFTVPMPVIEPRSILFFLSFSLRFSRFQCFEFVSLHHGASYLVVADAFFFCFFSLLLRRLSFEITEVSDRFKLFVPS